MKTEVTHGLAGQTWTLEGRQGGAAIEWPALGTGAVTGAVFFLALVSYLLTRAPTSPHIEHVLQAWSFLHGHAYLSHRIHEMVQVNGHWYDLHPPLSAVIMMPFVAIWGLNANQTLVCCLLGAISVALAWRLFLTLGLERESAGWLTVFYSIGTTFWYEATLGASWDFALVLSTIPTLLALNEACGRGRPWVVAGWAGLAAFARYDLMLAFPAYLILLWIRGKGVKELTTCFVGFLLALDLYLAYNFVRFGSIFDPTLFLWYVSDSYNKVRTHGPFSLYYLPLNLFTALYLGPGYKDQAPWLIPGIAGQALVLTSPALVLVFRASFKDARVRAMWLMLGMAMLPSMLVYASGFAQFGYRYFTQALPFALALIALGVPKPLDQMSKVLIVFSILSVSLGVYSIRYFA